MQPQTVTLIVAGLGIAGTLASGATSQWMTRRSQHDQWLRDQRKQEYRELLSALSNAYLHIVKYGAPRQGQSEAAPIVEGVRMEAFKTLHDRIFIAPEIKKAKIMAKWLVTLDALSERGRDIESNDMFLALTAELVTMAITDVSNKD